MNNKIQKLNDEQFRRKTGVKRSTFFKMVELVLEAETHRKKLSGRPMKLSYENQVLMMLEYLREYRTYFSLGQIYDVSEANCYKICRRIEDILIKAKEFRLPSKKDLYENPNIQVLVVDATESPIERPQKKQRKYYSGKKKRHTIKTQILIQKQTTKILKTSFTNGKTHDFKLFKQSQLYLNTNVNLLADTGYQGVVKIHTNSSIPHKKKRKLSLTKEQKKRI